MIMIAAERTARYPSWEEREDLIYEAYLSVPPEVAVLYPLLKSIGDSIRQLAPQPDSRPTDFFIKITPPATRFPIPSVFSASRFEDLLMSITLSSRPTYDLSAVLFRPEHIFNLRIQVPYLPPYVQALHRSFQEFIIPP